MTTQQGEQFGLISMTDALYVSFSVPSTTPQTEAFLKSFIRC